MKLNSHAHARLALNCRRKPVAKLVARLAALLFYLPLSGLAMSACLFSVPGWKVTNEGVLLARFANNVSGTGLTASTTYASGDPAQVRAAFDSTRLTFDVNGDGAVTGVDTAIVLRYVLGIRPPALAQGLALGSGARPTSAAITTFIAEGCQAPIAQRGPIYETHPATSTRAALLTQANAQGARGFRYVAPLFVGGDSVNLYAHDTPGTQVGFSYISLDTPNNNTDMIALLNSQGAQRYRFAGVQTTGTLFVRDEGSSRTYQYLGPNHPDTAAAFLTQANAQGANGYAFLLPYAFGLTIVAIYEKDAGTSTSATYSYATEASTASGASPDSFVTQANGRGASGWKFLTTYGFGDGLQNLYVKDLSQAASYAWKHSPDPASAAALVAQANTEGTLGYVYAGSVAFFPGGFGNPAQVRMIYPKPVNCAGFLMCAPRSPL